MKALLSVEPGGVETLRLTECPEPAAGPGQVKVAVKACGVNYPDSLIIEDRYQFRPQRPFAPGGEIAGIVEAVGAGVDSPKIGDRIAAMVLFGGMAEKVVVDADKCVLIPDSMPFDDASAFFFAHATAYYGLKNRGGLQRGDTLLVLGASGGVGLAAVEIGKALGARVIAAASSPAKLAAARQRGADDGLVYPSQALDGAGLKKLSADFKRLCGEGGANVVLDPVGGSLSEAALRAIAWEGRFLVLGFVAGIPKLPLNLPLLKSCQIVGVFYGSFVERDPQTWRQNNDELLDLYQRGLVRPYITARIPLERGGEAIAKLADRQAVGKVVVTIGPDV